MVGGLYLIIVINYFCSSIHCANDCTEVCNYLGDIVDCSQKKLKDVPLNIPTWTTHLILNNNRIKSFKSDAFQNLTHLTELKLNKNQINVIPKDAFDSLKQLKILNLNNNRIKSFKSDAFQHLTHLAELKLNKNKIKVIPKDAFDTLNQLKILELNRNQLEDIEALTFKSSEQLTALRLKNNRISQLKDGTFFGLTNIKFLALDYNSIQVISKRWLYGLSNLKQLTFSHNVINEIYTDAWEVCKYLIHLDLSFNQIKSIQKDTFKHLNSLQTLHLNNNNITFIKEGAFEHLPSLTILLLNNNHISWAIEDANGVFSSLKNLYTLYLGSNNIRSINKNAFRGLVNVGHLDLSDNNVTTIQDNAFMEMPALQELILNTSVLLCDCDLKWFYEWLVPEHFSIQTTCWYPEQLRGISLMEVEPSNFTCGRFHVKPRLIDEPALEIMALKGENISLICSAMSSANGSMDFIWKKDNVELINAEVNVVATTHDAKNTESTSVLNLYKVKNSDAGKYQCIISNKYGKTYSQKSSISVLIFPTFVKIPQNVTVRAGATARLECAAYGEPLPEIAWQKDGGNDFPAARERRMHVMPTDDVFFIVNAKPSDIGIYSCTANNAAGMIIANASLMIEEMPSFVKPMENKEITAGEPVILQCTAAGIPKPSIQWLKDDGPIHATERHFFTAEDQLLIIVDTILSDTGTYQCKLNNSLGTEIDYSEVIVKPDVSSDNQLMGIIIISVVCCAVLTSIVWVVIIYQTRKRMIPSLISMPFADNSSEHSLSKDSGTGNSTKRSVNDLLSADEHQLIIDDSSLYICDGNNAPLMHKNDVSNPTNHQRLADTEHNLDDRIDEEMYVV